MRLRSVLPLLALSLAACSSTDTPPTPSRWTDSLRVVMLERLAEDQAVRDKFVAALQSPTGPDSAMFAAMSAVDSSNTAWLRSMVASHGWPDRSSVGEDGAKAAFLMVQHADRDTAFQSAMLDSLHASFKRGQADGQSVALLTDRVAVARGLPQQYGTQTDVANGRITVKPMVDSANVDARRATMGLPPMSEYLRVLDSVYLGKRTP